MTSSDWTQTDYATARDYLSEHESEAARATLLDCGDGVIAVLPRGIPALGARFHGLFMLAPLPVFMVCAALLPLFGFTGSWELSPVTLAITAGCLALIWGLARVMRLVLKQRELFPRSFFVTLGEKGAAMHFTRLHFPAGPVKSALTWNQVQTIASGRAFGLPALLLGRPWIPVLRLGSEAKPAVLIPMPPIERDAETWTRLHALIEQRLP